MEISELEASRFWNKVEVTGCCWYWTGAKGKWNYGAVYLLGGGKWKAFIAHRVAYLILMGEWPVKSPDHICRNRLCVNPDHLENTTHRENVLRSRGPTALNAKKTHCKHGHEFDEANTRLRKTRYGTVVRQCKMCAKLSQTEHRQRMRESRHGK